MKRNLFVITWILLIFVVFGVSPIMASDISNAEFYGIITISNNSSSASSMISANITGANTTSLITGGFLNASANNCAIQYSGADVAFMPGFWNNPWVLFLNSITGNGNFFNILYTKNVTGGKVAYFPGPTGLSVGSNASLNIGNSGTFTWNVYLSPTSNGFLINYPGALTVFENGAGVLTAGVLNGSDLQYVNASSQYCNKAAGVVSPAGGNITLDIWFYWSAPTGAAEDILCAGDAGGFTYWEVYITVGNKLRVFIGNSAGAAWSANWVSTNNMTTTGWHLITAVYNSAAATRTTVDLDGVVIPGVDVGVGGNIAQPNTHLAVGAGRAGGAYSGFFNGYIDEVRISSTARTLAEHQAAYGGGGIPFAADGSTISLWHFDEGAGNPVDTIGNNNLTRVNNPTWSKNSPVMTVYISTGVIPEGERIISVYADGVNLGITVDATAYTTPFAGSIPAGTGNITFCSSDITPYINSIKVYKSGALTGYWYWEYGPVFYDHSGNGNTAIPSFRTTSSNSYITATFSAFYPVAEAKAPAFSVGLGPDFLSTNITISGNFTTGNITITYPGSEILRQLTSQTGVPYQLPSTFIATFLILVASMATSAFLKSHAGVSLFVKSIVNSAGYGIAVALQIYDWWMLIFFFIFEVSFWFAASERKNV